MAVSLFWRKFKNDPFWPKFTQIWPKFCHIWRYQAWSTGVQKKISSKILNLFCFFFSKSKKNYFGRKKSTFCPYKHHYDSPLPTLRKILKFLKWRFFAFFFEKNQKNYYFFHFFSWNMVSIVEVEIFGFLPFSNWPDFHPKWSKIGHFGPQMAQN